MRWILLVAITLLFAGCGGGVMGPSTIKDSFYITSESDLPDPGMARSEMRQQALFFLKKAKVNQAKFIYTRFQGKTHIQVIAEPMVILEGADVRSKKGGYQMLYKVVRTPKELAKLRTFPVHQVKAVGSNIESAFQNALEKVLQKVSKSADSRQVSGVFTIVDMGAVRYAPRSVSYDVALIVIPQKDEKLSVRHQANYLGELATFELARKKTAEAEALINQGFNLDQQCDRCYFARSKMRLDSGDATRALFNIKKALKINSKKLIYHQYLQKIYILLKDRKNSQLAAHQIVRTFNPDGSLIVREKAPVATTALTLQSPKVVGYQLKNGMDVTVVNEHTLPLVQFSVGFRFGAAHAPTGKQGAVKAMIALLKEGSKEMDQVAIARFIDQYGLYFWHSVAGDYTQINCATLKENGDQCLKLFSQLLMQPTFPEKGFNRYMKKQVQLYQVKSARSSFLASKMLYRLLYNDHPYMYYDATLKTLTSIKLADIKGLYSRLLHGGNAHLILSGDIDQTLKEQADKLFGDWKSGAVIKDYQKDTVKRAEETPRVIYLIHQPKRPQSTILYGNLTTSYQHEDFISLMMANQIFGGNASSRLFMALREKEGLTYGIYSGLSKKIQKGVFIISSQVRAEVTGQAIVGILSEIKKVNQSGFLPSELSNKKRLITGKLAISLQRIAALNDYILKQKFFGMKNQPIGDYLKKINALTVNDLNRVFRQYIHPKQSVIVVAGDYKKILPTLKGVAPVYVFDQNFKRLNVK